MASNIQWLARPGTIPETLNFVGGCTRVSEGCENCWAMRAAWRMSHHPNPLVSDLYRDTVHKINYTDTSPPGYDWTGQINLAPERIDRPRHWRKPRTIFVCSTSDLFHNEVPAYIRVRLWKMMSSCPQHTFILLTKRSRNMMHRVQELVRMFGVLSNVWGLVTTENQGMADGRIPHLLRTPFAVRGISAEPLLAPLYVERYLPLWIIIGCESGPNRRDSRLSWALDLIRQGRSYSQGVFVKQLLLDDGRVSTNPEEWPLTELNQRSWPMAKRAR